MHSTAQHISCRIVAATQAAVLMPAVCLRSQRGVRLCSSVQHKPFQRQHTIRWRITAAVARVHRLCSRQPVRCSSSSGAVEPAPRVAVEGDVVTFHMTCKEGEMIVESTKKTTQSHEPLSFELGAGEIMGNPLFQAFDGALRGLAVGESADLEVSGGEWKNELLFAVPRDHPEIERLEGRYKNIGGLREGLAVELANGSMAVVVEATDATVKLDANNMMAGKQLLFKLELLSIERGGM